MADDLTSVPGKVEAMRKELNEFRKQSEGDKSRLASLELKAAVHGKLSVQDMIKVGGLVVSLTLMVSGLVQMFVRGSQAEALQGIRSDQARMSGEIESLKSRVQETENALSRRTDWMQDTGGQVASVMARVDGLERSVEMGTQSRWTAEDHQAFARALDRELSLIWKELNREGEE